MQWIRFTALAMCLMLVSCERADELTQFDMDYTETIVVPSSSGINLPFNLTTPETETNSETTFQNNDTRKDLIEEIKVTEVTLTLTQPSSADFSFLESIEVFIQADGLDETRVAWQENVPENVGSTLSLNTSDMDLQEYVKKDEIVLRARTVTDEALTSDHHIEVYTNFFVNAKVLGQ